MNNYKILLVEDDSRISETLVEILEFLEHQVVGMVDCYEGALSILDTEKVDLILLDIQLKSSKTGLDLATEINKSYKIPYVFTTAYADEETVRQASELSPYGYILKPYGLNDIKVAIEIGMSNYIKSQIIKEDQADFLSKDHLYVKVNSKLIRLAEDDILYIESKGDYTIFKTVYKGFVVNSTLKNVVQKMNPRKFLKVHRSYVVNLDKINDIYDSSIMIDSSIIPVSRQQKESLMERINLI